MSSKDLILGRVRAALADDPAVPEVPRSYRREFPPADLDVLIDRLVDYKAVVHRGSDVAAIVGDIIGAGTLVVPPGLPKSWLPPESPARVDAAPGIGLGPETGPHSWLDQAAIVAADGVVTGAAVAIAETGTIVLDGSPDQGRRILTLLPDLHICVLRPDQVVASVPEAIARLDPARPLTWISGPSATSDIELNRVEGVHGPRNLHVIIWEAA
ncbi:LutC/YkgG family protein [Paractinoplanes atraurantiacus]|uniref:L-lactate dehydrogenase complex protein LldG n=1 Tax=Paractinoplanes atraurantiacus TaxID=1036182 RepID=A0A285JNX0_9ACTN|nr:LUD domain-containing protein [Actinoplanes atraurantiacus]SNY61958.1 L-lactate dehydrogenase complex protein LldG [Actinoplanes atraurantiacus]